MGSAIGRRTFAVTLRLGTDGLDLLGQRTKPHRSAARSSPRPRRITPGEAIAWSKIHNGAQHAPPMTSRLGQPMVSIIALSRSAFRRHKSTIIGCRS